MGFLIIISGIDGSGKSTLGNSLMGELVTKGMKVQHMECGPLRSWTLLEQLSHKGSAYAKHVMEPDRMVLHSIWKDWRSDSIM